MKIPNQLEVLGVMSGTSLDGLDLVICRFHRSRLHSYDLIAHQTRPFPDALQHRLARAVEVSAEELFSLDADLGYWIGDQINEFLSGRDLPDAIASHGHTVFHQPENHFTVQIGNGAHIHARTGLPVISDFRTLDVALGGQGAPLVPAGDALLWSEYDYCLNLGGIANISYDIGSGNRVAFDITFCNMVLNYLSAREGKSYDRGGKMAASGTYLPELAEKLDKWEYYSQKPPKSLGFEQVSQHIFPLLEKGQTQDLLHTCTRHIAGKVIDACLKRGKMLITGGGAHNEYLRKCLEDSEIEIEYPEKNLVDYKEAIVFALLGALRLWGMPNVLASVTGASRDSVGGQFLG